MLKRVKDAECLAREQSARIKDNEKVIIDLLATKEKHEKIIPDLEEKLRIMTLKHSFVEEKFTSLRDKDKER